MTAGTLRRRLQAEGDRLSHLAEQRNEAVRMLVGARLELADVQAELSSMVDTVRRGRRGGQTAGEGGPVFANRGNQPCAPIHWHDGAARRGV
jgi:hypothetical protein